MCFQVVLAYEVIVLCKCSGKYIDIYFKLKITCLRAVHVRVAPPTIQWFSSLTPSVLDALHASRSISEICVSYYSRGGQTAAREPYAAL